MATNQDSNRRSLHSIIKNEFISVKTNKTLTYDEWFNLFFKNANTLTDEGSTSDENGTKYNNLFTTINFKKIKSGGDLTVINYYFKTTAKNSADWRKKLTSKEEFYKSFACDLPWAQTLNFCKGSNNTPTNIDNIVGEYSTDSSVVKDLEIYKSKDPNDITKDTYYLISADLLKVPMLGEYTTSKLIPTNNSSVYSLSSTKSDEELKNVITFDNTGFTFQFLTFTIKATKITQTKPVDTTKKDVTPKKDDTVVKKDKDDEIPVVRSKPLYFDTDKKDDTPTNPCSDFPFTLGCINTKIGDLNAKLFRGDRKKDTYTKSLQSTLDTGNFGSENPNKELTKDLWDELMNRQVIKESVKKVLKEYINKKK